MCQAYWDYKIQCCECSKKCHLAMDTRLISQYEIMTINSGGAASMQEMYEAHITVDGTQRGYK